MKVIKLNAVASVLACLFATHAFAAADESLVEKVSVRNKIFATQGRFELGFAFEAGLLSRLTDTYNFNVTVGYNFLESFAVEARLGYAYSAHTSLANQIASDFNSNGSVMTATDLSDLWQMTANGTVGIRWQPIYGKLSLMSELAVHFQFYVWLGGGAGYFHRESVVICNQKQGADCASFFTENAVKPMGALAVGMRFMFLGNHAIKLEIRDFAFPDSFFENVNRAAALTPSNPTGNGNLVANPGITNVSVFSIGYSYLF
jgi:outer membrane beta-barrel protein